MAAETDPLSVHTTGGTMIGQLVVKGDTFSTTPGVMIQPSSGSGGVGITLGPFGDEGISFAKSTGAAANLRINAIAIFGSGYPNVQVSSTYVILAGDIPSNATISLRSITPALTVNLALNSSGDLIVSQTTGPNAGKSVNLTSGKWV